MIAAPAAKSNQKTNVSDNGRRLSEGDGAAIGEKETIELAGQVKAEILLFGLA